MSVECSSRLEADGDYLHAIKVREWVENLPDGAVIGKIVKDFGNQRDPDVRLVGLRASERDAPVAHTGASVHSPLPFP